MLELDIGSRDYDFPGMAGQIEAYCGKNRIAARTAGRIQLAFEETAQMLVSLSESPRIQAVCEYSEAAESAEWTFRYCGPQADVTASGDELALSVLKGITSSMDYQREENADLQNVLRLVIRK